MRIILLAILFLGLNVYGQQKISLFKLNIEHGLSQSVVNDVLIDSKGFLWVGTQNGLNRYDGYHFKVFNNFPEDEFSISSGFINALAEDANENLWVGTQSGLNKFNSRKQRFEHWGLPSNEIVFPEINVISLLVDNENFVWALLPNYLVRINPVKESVKIFAFGQEESDFKHCFSTSLVENSSGNIWFVKGNQLVLFDRVFERFEFFDIKLPSHVSCLSSVFEFEHELFVMSDQQLWKLSSTMSPKLVASFNSRVTRVLSKDDQCLFVDNYGIYKLNNLGVQKKFCFGDPYRGFERFFVSVATVDKSHNIWVGTSGKGLMKLNIEADKFQVIKRKVSEKNYLTDDQVSSILIENDRIWIGTYEYGVNLINKKTQQVEQICLGNGNIPFSNNVYDIAKTGSRYVLSTERGIIVLEKNNRGRLIKKNYEDIDEIDAHIYQTISYRQNEMFFSYSGQLCHYNFKTQKLNKWVFDIENKTSTAKSFCLELVAKSFVFVGTSYGLYRFDLRNRIWDRFLFNRKESSSISGNNVYALSYDSLGHLWVGTSNGLDMVSDPFSKNLNFQTIGQDEKITVYSIMNSEKHTWAGTGEGLMRYSYSDKTISFFHQEDGLPCDEFNNGAIATDKNGNFAFGGQGGVVFFHPDSILLSNFRPEVEISEAIIYNNRGKREQVVYSGATVELKPSDFLMNIYFTALDHTAPGRLQYRYKVNGSEWVEIGNQNYASFSNLQPGEYTIEINGSNADRKWSTSVAYLTINVLRPWYFSYWAYAFYAVFLMVFILITIETRTRRLRLTNQVLKEKEASAKQVARQKDRLQLLHKNMTESMSYASRIQQALLPTETIFKRVLPESFVLHKPKDIVSGDFYWITEMGPKICVAAVDCTGHGVPGALMSVIAVELLKKVVVKEGYKNPAEILEQIDISLFDLFNSEQEEDQATIADGMDMGICMIDRETLVLEYAGAINSLYYVRNKQFMEKKGDRMPVGMACTIEGFSYTNHFVDFSEDDVFYMASDGYSDQFGGPNNKKYKNKKLKTFLLTIANHDMDMQQLLLDNNYNKWRGNNEQIDDVMVIGFKPKFFSCPIMQ